MASDAPAGATDRAAGGAGEAVAATMALGSYILFFAMQLFASMLVKLQFFTVEKSDNVVVSLVQSADFFGPDNKEGIEARNELDALAMEDMIDWMHGGGQVGIFDATNSTRKRRYMLMKMAEGNCKIIFLETICNDRNIIERNVRLKIQQSPDYVSSWMWRFYENYAAREMAMYVEKVVESPANVVEMLDAMAGMFSLVVVGQGGRQPKELLVGLDEWAEAGRELGAMAEILVSNTSMEMGSMLIMQQHRVLVQCIICHREHAACVYLDESIRTMQEH
ncbi:6-phosphofructo-2-kinase/fructose-2,6-bisphosphatase-like isoform X2 [Triticum dicoccoides]|nr:6-phosphofructo-2-kinase/fructose-2,6-bisphosphatase-like isoform X2 [Triticum dicoccoides]